MAYRGKENREGQQKRRKEPAFVAWPCDASDPPFKRSRRDREGDCMDKGGSVKGLCGSSLALPCGCSFCPYQGRRTDESDRTAATESAMPAKYGLASFRWMRKRYSIGVYNTCITRPPRLPPRDLHGVNFPFIHGRHPSFLLKVVHRRPSFEAGEPGG